MDNRTSVEPSPKFAHKKGIVEAGGIRIQPNLSTLAILPANVSTTFTYCVSNSMVDKHMSTVPHPVLDQVNVKPKFDFLERIVSQSELDSLFGELSNRT